MPRVWLAPVLLGLVGLLGCAAAPAPPTAVVSQRAVTVQQVLAILRRRHVEGALGDAQLSERTFDALLSALDPRSRCAGARERSLPERPFTLAALRRGEVEWVQRLAMACTGQRLVEDAALALALDALAGAFDPHSRFVGERELSAEQAQIHSPLPEAQQARGRLVERDGARIALVVLPSFYLQSSGRSAARDVRFLVDQLAREGASVLLLDLRGNRGGVIEEALRLLAALGCEGAVAREQRAGATVRELRARRDPAAYRGPLALLIDGGTAGVSELFAAAIQDRGRGVVLGARSVGHGSGQTLVLLRSPRGHGAGGVRVTDRYFLRVNGTAIEGRGVVPDGGEGIGAKPGEVDEPLIRSVLETVRR